MLRGRAQAAVCPHKPRRAQRREERLAMLGQAVYRLRVDAAVTFALLVLCRRTHHNRAPHGLGVLRGHGLQYVQGGATVKVRLKHHKLTLTRANRVWRGFTQAGALKVVAKKPRAINDCARMERAP